MTWSIVTHDPASGAFAVSVATKAFAVGASCPLVRSKKSLPELFARARQS